MKGRTQYLAALALVFLFGCGDDTETSTTPTGPQSDASVSGDDGSMGPETDASMVDPESDTMCEGDDSELVRPEHWTRASHCKGEDPNYDLLFDDAVVHRLDITVSGENYQATMDDLAVKLSGGGRGDLSEIDEPIYVPVDLSFNEQAWNHVGMRYKGNSSLKQCYSRGIRKLSFRFLFDKYEDDHPEIHNQRFYGFKKMTFSNGFKDSSLMRDKLGADLFRAGGVPAARGAFVRVHMDFGEGPVYMGLYTMIEDPSDEMLDAQFGDDSGNLYKPDGDGARWQQFVEDSFPKKTNEDEADWSDVDAAIAILNGDRSDAEDWRNRFEAVFDVPAFLRVLAINQAMVNWDSYGFMTHNYYVYSDPTDEGRLTWFPWDLNECMLVMGGGRRGTDPTSVMLDDVGDDWPLIRFLLDDPVYRAIYRDELNAFLDGAFAVESVHEMMERYHALISPWITGAEGESTPYSNLRNQAEFEDSLTSGQTPLKAHVESRHDAVRAALEME